jgi:hypothetical protein
MALFAVLAAVLAGFVGLVIDGGRVASQQQLARNAADGAALTGAYAIGVQGTTLATATSRSQQVLTAVGLPTGDLTLAYLDVNGSPTSTPANVATVQATVVDNQRTFFLSALGVTTFQVSAVTQASTGLGGTGFSCAMCVMAGAGTTFLGMDTSVTNVTGGPVIVNSTGSPNIQLDSSASFTAPSITIAGGSYSLGSGATISPTPVTGSAVADALSSVPAPSVSGSPVNYTSPGGSTTISPGIYSGINADGTSLTLNPGIYVLTGLFQINSGSVTGSGVMIYLTCSSYPTPCASGGSGGYFDFSRTTDISLSPPTSGTYAGLTVFADRNNNATNIVDDNNPTVTGTWYTLKMPFSQTSGGKTLKFGQFIAPSITLDKGTSMTVNYVPSQSYGAPSGGVKITQ